MYSNIKFYKKDNELQEIYFPVQLAGLKRVNGQGENSGTYDFNEIKTIYIYIYIYIQIDTYTYKCI